MSINIDTEIQKLIEELKKEYQIPSYVYNNNKFIPGTTPIYYSGPYFGDEEIVASVRSLLVGKWISGGETSKEFEHGFSRKFKQSFSVFVNSGSSANLIMISALKKRFNWQDGDEIIISAVGFPTSYSVLIQNNLTPVFVDIEMETLNFDLTKIEEKITSKTKAILLSPVLGNPPDMTILVEICKVHGLELILDNCDSLGSKWNDKYLTEYSIASSCSFYAAHHICTLEGGMVSSSDRGLMNIARSMVNWGRGCVCSGVENLLPNGICNHRFDKWLNDYDGIIDHKYLFEQVGYNLKGLDLQASIGLIQLEKFEEIKSKRKEHKKIISELFWKYMKGISIPKQYSQADVSDFGTAFIVENKKQKDRLVSYLEKSKIQTRNYFAGNIMLHPAYKHLGDYKDYPNANKVLDQVFFIGCAPHYTPEVFDYIEDVLKNYDK